MDVPPVRRTGTTRIGTKRVDDGCGHSLPGDRRQDRRAARGPRALPLGADVRPGRARGPAVAHFAGRPPGNGTGDGTEPDPHAALSLAAGLTRKRHAPTACRFSSAASRL